ARDNSGRFSALHLEPLREVESGISDFKSKTTERRRALIALPCRVGRRASTYCSHSRLSTDNRQLTTNHSCRWFAVLLSGILMSHPPSVPARASPMADVTRILSA